MIGFLISAVKIIFLLGFLILIHESGHFFIAKLFKVKVEEFAIGFGPKIFTKQGKETKYELRLIPLGGFVRMEGEEQRSDNERSFNNASIPKRMGIVAAGAIVNIVFGILVYFIIVAVVGNNVSNIVDTTNEGYIASEVGIISGDKIEKINNKKIRLKSDIDEILQNYNGEELTLLLERNNEEIEIKLKPTEKYTKSTGIYVSQAQTGDKATQIIQIEKGSNAEKDGLQANDVIKTINGIDVTGDVQKLVNEIQNTTSDKAKIEVERNNEIIELELTIDSIPTYYLGINFRMAENNFTNNIYYAFYRTGEFLASIAENIKMLFTGNVGLDQMTGPIGISNMVSRTTGFADFMYLLALVSISLGITNLLPIPALDGGKLLILLIEAIRRKPMKEELEIGIQLVGFFILISLSIIISYKDILRIF